jgi:hypothetical protein
VSFRRVLRIGVAISLPVDEDDADGHDDKVRDDPEIFPERVDALERQCVKGESPDQ